MALQDEPGDGVIAVVIPAYNEARRIGRSLQRIDAYAASAGRRMHVIVVDDGSRDGTAAAVAVDKPRHVTIEVVSNEGNRGKGYSVRRGVLRAVEAEGVTAVLFSDADMSTPIPELDHLWDELERGADVAIGSRNLAESEVEPKQGFFRRTLGAMFRSVRRMILLRDILDTQCGFKLFTAEAAREVFGRCHVDGFAFDCEVLAAARARGYSIREVGVTWRNDDRSTLSPFRHMFAVGRDLLAIRARFGPQHVEKAGGKGKAARGGRVGRPI